MQHSDWPFCFSRLDSVSAARRVHAFQYSVREAFPLVLDLASPQRVLSAEDQGARGQRWVWRAGGVALASRRRSGQPSPGLLVYALHSCFVLCQPRVQVFDRDSSTRGTQEGIDWQLGAASKQEFVG